MCTPRSWHGRDDARIPLQEVTCPWLVISRGHYCLCRRSARGRRCTCGVCKPSPGQVFCFHLLKRWHLWLSALLFLSWLLGTASKSSAWLQSHLRHAMSRLCLILAALLLFSLRTRHPRGSFKSIIWYMEVYKTMYTALVCKKINMPFVEPSSRFMIESYISEL